MLQTHRNFRAERRVDEMLGITQADREIADRFEARVTRVPVHNARHHLSSTCCPNPNRPLPVALTGSCRVTAATASAPHGASAHRASWRKLPRLHPMPWRWLPSFAVSACPLSPIHSPMPPRCRCRPHDLPPPRSAFPLRLFLHAPQTPRRCRWRPNRPRVVPPPALWRSD